MKTEIYIVAAALIGTSIGYLIGAFFASQRVKRIQQNTWNEARRFYLLAADERKNSSLIH